MKKALITGINGQDGSYLAELDQLFEIGKHLITYDSADDLIQKINYYLNNETKRNEIAKNGYEHVIKNHTYLKRMEQLIEILKKEI